MHGLLVVLDFIRLSTLQIMDGSTTTELNYLMQRITATVFRLDGIQLRTNTTGVKLQYQFTFWLSGQGSQQSPVRVLTVALEPQLSFPFSLVLRVHPWSDTDSTAGNRVYSESIASSRFS